jgi:PAS domain-containing protein
VTQYDRFPEQDQNERREAQQVLRANESRFRSTLENLMEGCQIIDRQWRYVYVNAAAARHGGTSVDALVGRTMMEAYPRIEETAMYVNKSWSDVAKRDSSRVIGQSTTVVLPRTIQDART